MHKFAFGIVAIFVGIKIGQDIAAKFLMPTLTQATSGLGFGPTATH